MSESPHKSPPQADDAARGASPPLWASLLVWLAALTPMIVLVWPARPYALDLLSHLAPWWCVLWLAASAGFLVARRRRAAIAFGASAIGAIAMLIGLHRPAPSPPAASGAQLVRVVEWNAGSLDAPESQAFIDWIHQVQPDIILIPEATRRLYYFDQSPLAADYPHQWRSPGAATVYCRWPIQPIRGWSTRITAGENLIRVRPVVMQPHDRPAMLIVGVYLPSPRTPKRWNASLDAITDGLAALDEYEQYRGLPRIAGGDFNSTPQGRAYRKMIQTSGMIDAARSFQFTGTWPATFPSWLRAPIDHVFVSRDIHIQSYTIGPNLGSDHRPVLVELLVRGLGDASLETAAPLD